MLNQVELTERRISSVVAGIEQTQERVVAVVTRVSQTVTAIDVIVAEAALLTRRAAPLLDAYQQPLEQLAANRGAALGNHQPGRGRRDGGAAGYVAQRRAKARP